jgi:alanyl-tRNA synthetase
MALFGEKYGDEVRVVMVDDFSRELCGGTHVTNTGQIGLMKILAESSVGAGLRRVEAVTGQAALDYLAGQENMLKDVAGVLKTTPGDIITRIEEITREARSAERELQQMKSQMAAEEAGGLVGKAEELSGVRVLVSEVGSTDAGTLRQTAETLKDKLGDSVVVLASVDAGKISFAGFAAPAVVKRGIHVGNIVGQVAKVAGGGGGGRPDMAQAGGKDPAKVGDALELARVLISRSLTS